MTASEDSATGSKRPLRDGIDTVKHRIGGAGDHAADAYHSASDRAADAYLAASERAAESYAAARENATFAIEDALDRIEANPLIAVAGGLALGVLIGALLPRTERERQLYGAVGDRLNATARDAAEAAKDAGREKLADLGISRDHARDTVRTIIDAAISAAASAGGAAIDTARDRGKQAY